MKDRSSEKFWATVIIVIVLLVFLFSSLHVISD